jgi:hypothetical protein
MKPCKSCGSPQPHLHPAVQFEGEVETCTDDFHMRPTPQNTPAYKRPGITRVREHMIADDIIDAAARHRKIKPAVEQMVELMYQEPQSNTSEVNHEFECEIRGQKFDVEISLRVSTKKKH